MRRIDQAIITILLLLVLAGVAFVVWTGNPAQPMPQALAALQSDAQVQVDAEPWWIFQPRTTKPTVGLIIYPGALVDARAYAPTARAIAAKGYLVVIMPMPFNLALFGTDRALQVPTVFPWIRRWAIAGHSLGGVAACGFAKNYAAVRGLVLWASYPSDGDDLSQRDLLVVSIYGTQDKLSTPEKITASRTKLPSATRFVAIEGGNHAQFGWYGTQSGDGEATISREQQREQIVNATVELLGRLEHIS
jgi:pimeloyl-ACP methyl ester carboxylesterase